MKRSIRKASVSLAVVGLLAVPLSANAANYYSNYYYGSSIPSVVITVENSAPSRGTFQTPVWIGIHDGTFDIYDRDVALGADGLVPVPAVERLAEDGSTSVITEEFDAVFLVGQSGAPQATLLGPTGPLAPGDRSSVTLNIDPSKDRFFSYASMVIPSNDAFIANGNPVAHELFDTYGRFVGDDFAVAGSEVLDAGTEVNDEVATNTAFLAQANPNTGTTESGVVVLSSGFRTDLAFPDGVLNHPALGRANFLESDYRVASFSFRYVDLGQRTIFRTSLRPENQVSALKIDSRGRGFARLVALGGEQVQVNIRSRRTNTAVLSAHLHLGQTGTNGPVVADLSNAIYGNRIRTTIRSADVTGPLAEEGDPMRNLLNELAAGNIYVNLHTEDYPNGELRGQVALTN